MAEVLDYDPDMIILATGHNEFLEDRSFAVERQKTSFTRAADTVARNLRTVRVLRRVAGYDLPQEPDKETAGGTVEARLDNAAGYASYKRDLDWQAAVRQQFASSLDDMATRCQAVDVPLMLVKLGGNLRDCPPFKSEHAGTLSLIHI